MFDGEDEAKENEIIAAVVAILLAGAITFILWPWSAKDSSCLNRKGRA